MIKAIKSLLLLGITLSLLLIFLGYPEWGAFALILTPLCRNLLFGIDSLFHRAFLFAALAFFTIAIILFT